MLAPVARISSHLRRSVTQVGVRHGSHGGVPGENLPFDINSKARLTFNMFWYVGSAIAAPFLIVYHQLNKE